MRTTYRFGDRVVITAGSAAGREATIVELTKHRFDDEWVWLVKLPMPDGDCAIRETFLRRVA